MAYARGLCQGYPLMPSLKVSIPCKGSCLIKSFLLMFEILHSMISTHECFFSSISVWIREDEKKQSRGEMPSFAYRRRQEILALKVYSVSYSSRFFIVLYVFVFWVTLNSTQPWIQCYFCPIRTMPIVFTCFCLPCIWPMKVHISLFVLLLRKQKLVSILDRLH